MEECSNCGRVIGKLETPRVFEGNVVCAACWGVLTAQTEPVGYEAGVDTSRRLRPRQGGFSVFLIAGRIVFGGATAFLLWMALEERAKVMGQPERFIFPIIFTAFFFGLTFVKRAFPR